MLTKIQQQFSEFILIMGHLQNVIKEAPLLPGASEEYRRLEYSLKMNLRLVNGKFKDMKIHRVNQVERFPERTQIEAMEMVTPANAERLDQLTQTRGRLNIPKGNPKLFTFGTIIEKAEDLSEDTEYTFCVFRVGVGKSYSHKLQPDEIIESIPPKEGYDSINIETENPNKVFQMKYLIHQAELATLTYVIICRIEVEDIQAQLDLSLCSICQNPAQVYCEQDRAYFCEPCDELAHAGEDQDVSGLDERSRRLHALRGNHNRGPIPDARPMRFGFCLTHTERHNEYYDRMTGQAHCALCAMDLAQNKKDGQSSLVSLESAYALAKTRATNPDAALDQKKQMIRHQMDQISGRIAGIKTQATNARAAITQTVEQALKELYEIVQHKTNILKADRLELARQYKEIQFMSDYLHAQMDGTDPIEFLRLSQGHDLLKLQVVKQQTQLSEIEIDISVNSQLQIKSDKTIRKLNLEDTQNEKQVTINKVQNTMQDKKASTGHRSRLFGQKDLNISGTGGLSGLNSKIPQIPRSLNPADLQYSNAVDKANTMAQRERMGLGPPQKQTQEVQNRIEKLFNMIDEKTQNIAKNKNKQNQNASIVQDSIQRSIFGVFSQNYKLYRDLPGKKETVKIWQDYFIASSILDDVQRSLLYFNLPFDSIIREEIKPELLFQQDLRNISAKGNNFLNDMLNTFEQAKDGQKRLANIILLQVPNSQQDYSTSGNKQDDFQIVGGYASDGWAASQELLGEGGDETCFLFNLTQNLRFNAVKGRGPYQVTDTQSDQKMNRRILFGQVALVIENDFKRVTSNIGHLQDPKTHFVFGDELMQKSKVDSIIPGKKEFDQPQAVEVWSFSLKH